MPAIYYLIQTSPVILACLYGLGLAFKHWPINQTVGKLMISAFMLKLAGVAWVTFWWAMMSARTGGSLAFGQVVTASGIFATLVEAVALTLLAIAVVYGRPGAVWPLRSG